MYLDIKQIIMTHQYVMHHSNTPILLVELWRLGKIYHHKTSVPKTSRHRVENGRAYL